MCSRCVKKASACAAQRRSMWIGMYVSFNSETALCVAVVVVAVRTHKADGASTVVWTVKITRSIDSFIPEK